MADYTLTTLDGGTSQVEQGAVDALAASLTGELLTPDSADWRPCRLRATSYALTTSSATWVNVLAIPWTEFGLRARMSAT